MLQNLPQLVLSLRWSGFRIFILNPSSSFVEKVLSFFFFVTATNLLQNFFSEFLKKGAKQISFHLNDAVLQAARKMLLIKKKKRGKSFQFQKSLKEVFLQKSCT